MTLNIERGLDQPQVKPKLSDMKRDDSTAKHEKSLCDYYWSKKPGYFNCLDISEIISKYELQDSPMLEVGSGDSVKSSEGVLGKKYVGVDISMVACRMAQKRNPDANFVNADARYLPFRDESFDLVVSFEVLHLLQADLYAGLKEMTRVTSFGISFDIQHRDRIGGGEKLGNGYGSMELDVCLATAPLKDGKLDIGGSRTMFFFDGDGVTDLMKELGYKQISIINNKLCDDGHVEYMFEHEPGTPIDSLHVRGGKKETKELMREDE